MVKTYYAVFAEGSTEPWLLSQSDPRQNPVLVARLGNLINVMTVKKVKVVWDWFQHHPRNGARRAILSLFVTGHPLATWDIVERVGLTSGTVRQTLSKMVNLGQIVRVRHRVYKLPTALDAESYDA